MAELLSSWLPVILALLATGAVVRHPDGLLEGASDPRSDGAAMGY